MGISIDRIEGDQRGIIAIGDVKDASLIQTGDISGSYNAIGDGASLVVQQVEAFSPAAESQKAEDVANRRLVRAVTNKVKSYQRLVQKSNAGRLNPYKSLNFYQLEDAPYFYGRAQAIPELLDKIYQSRLTVLYADSGSGKSSLLQAGIQSRLLAAGHLPVDIRLQGLEPVAQSIKKAVTPELASELQPEPLETFLTKINRFLGESNLLLFLDQFEEFFTRLSPEQQKTFIGELHACLNQGELDVRWVLSLRGEYLYRLHPFGSRARSNEFYLPPFTETEARQVIVQPMAGQQTTYEEGLVEQILNDLSRQAERPDEGYVPPQVQLVCHTLFEQVKGRQQPRVITEATYEAAGRVRGILTSHLERTISLLPNRLEQDVAHEILEALVTVSLEKDRLRDIRTGPQLSAEVEARIQGADQVTIRNVLSFLVNNYLLRIERDLDLGDRYELTHDYLLTEIELDDSTRQRKLAEQMLRQEVDVYLSSGKKTLIAADKLALIEPQVENMFLDTDAEELIKSSRAAITAAQEKEHRQRRVIQASGGLAVLFVIVAIIAGILALSAIEDATDLNGTVAVDRLTATAGMANVQIQQTTDAAQFSTAASEQASAETSVANALITLDAIQGAGTAVAGTATAAAYALQAQVKFTYNNYQTGDLPENPILAESANLKIAMTPSSAVNQSLLGWSTDLVMADPVVLMTSNLQNVDQHVSATVDGTAIEQINTFTGFVGNLGEFANPDLWQDATIEAILIVQSPGHWPQTITENLFDPPDMESFDTYYGIDPATREAWADSDYWVSPVLPATLDIYVAGRQVATLNGITAAVGEWDEDVRGLYVTRFLSN
ncbi:MAG: hypothetical protein R3293_16325 [Candidatus Promineifilaceae bacterium]|nr:hypothetical protein [Candidatus Promineifilaceae bacterium]